MANFNFAIDYVLENEGGFVDDPLDHGGATNRGITQETLARFRGKPVSVQDVKEMMSDETEKIYESYYWKPLHLDQVSHQGMATALLDVGVLNGIITSARYAQFICKDAIGSEVLADGKIGPLTISAINSIHPDIFIPMLSNLVIGRYRKIVINNSDQAKFLPGWTARAKKLLTLADVGE